MGMRLPRRLLGAVAAMALFAGFPSHANAAGGGAEPTVAVYGFNSGGLNPWWGPDFDPGAALSSLLTDQLVNTNKFSVVDRAHVEDVLREKNMAQSGDVSPATSVQIGHLIGAGYLVEGRIIQFDKTASNAGAVGGLIGGALGVGGVKGDKVTLHVSVHVIDATTGRIVQAIDQEQSATGTSFAIVGIGRGIGAGYSSQNFLSSTMGKLLNSAAQGISEKIDPTKMVATAPAAQIVGRIIAIDQGAIVLNVGANKNVQTGMFFDVFEVKKIKDPDSGKMLTTEIKRGTVQILSVDAQTAVAKQISGTAKVAQEVKSQ
ncbi:MAG TPA: CsgG/HfaB family protein [Candidatus Dormibacteraeota bacterium]|nr:CsgG/HfaB family protein [Candidatus Dormibacteraeota bacterium]